MTKIGGFGAALNSLFKIGHRETVNGTRRSDRKLPRDSTKPVRSKSVKFADDVERTEREAIDSQEQPAAGEDRGDLHLDECLKALSQRSKNTERHITSRHKALEQADQLCAPADSDELDVVRLRKELERLLSNHKPRELRTIIRNALEAHFTADEYWVGENKKTREAAGDAADAQKAAAKMQQSTGQRREQVMKTVVEACLDRLSQMKKVTPLQDFHPPIDSRFLDYACARWLLEPAEKFVNALGGTREALDAACGRLIVGYKAFGRGLFARVLFDEVGDRGSLLIDYKMGEIARRGAALADAAMSSQLDALSRGDLYVTARIMRNAAWAYFLKRQTVYGLTRGLNPSAARRSAEKVVKGYSLEPKKDHSDWAENYSRPVGEKTGIGDKADVAGSGRRDGAVRDSELPRSAESQQATEWLAQAYPRYGDRVARGRGARKVHDELDALISESEASTSSAHSQPQSTSPMNAQPQSTSATQAAPASDQPQLSAERLFDLLAVGEARTQASLANTHEASAGPYFEQPAAPDENFRQPSPLSARPRIDNTPIDYHEELPDRLQMSNVKLGEDELGRALLVPDDPQRRDENDKSSSRPGKPKPRQHVPSARPAWQPDLPSRAKRKELVLPQSRRERMQEAAGKVFSAIMDRNIEDYLMGLDAYNRAILTFGGDTAYAPIVQGVMDSFAEEDQDKMMANMGVLHAAVTSAVEQFGEGGAQLANLRTTNDNMWRNFGSIETIATTREVGVGTRTLHALYGVEGASLGLVRQPRAKGAKTSTVDADSVDPNTPTTSPRSVGWKPKSPRRNPEELSDTLVASILGQDFGQALRALHELARPGVSRRQIAKLVGESFRSSNTDPTAANVGKFQAIVSSLGTWPRAVADKRAGRRLRETVDNMVRLWSQLKRDPYISGVEHSKISDEELKSAIAMVKELDAMESPPAHDRPKLLKKPSRPGAKPTLRKA